MKQAAQIGFLHQIVVDKGHRGQGLGLSLVREMQARLKAQNITKVQAEHYAFNAGSATLMQAAGLHPISIIVEGGI